MTDTQALRSFIIRTVRESLDDTVVVTGETPLLGKNAVMSSLALVGLLVRVEDYCREHDLPFSWTTDAAMSGKNGPFRSVDALVGYLDSLNRGESL